MGCVFIHAHRLTISLLLLFAIPMGPCFCHLGDPILFWTVKRKDRGMLGYLQREQRRFGGDLTTTHCFVKLPADSGKHH